MIDQHDLLRLAGKDLAAKLRTNRTTRTGDHHDLAFVAFAGFGNLILQPGTVQHRVCVETLLFAIGRTVHHFRERRQQTCFTAHLIQAAGNLTLPR